MDFEAAFETLTGNPPFRWQARLHEELAQGRLPDAVDVPTGLGKTAVMALWLLARARNPGLPKRLVYVVDRRAVVDQASAEAQKLAAKLSSLGSAWRDRIGIAEGGGLAVSTLRGQLADNRRWLEDPSCPAVVVGTVDMIGSRLLFRGFRVSPGMRPVHAGLLGADALIVLDEAHLVPPFEAMVRQAAALAREDRETLEGSPVPGLRLMTLSATGRHRAGARVFALDDSDHGDPRTAKRLGAEKRLRILPEVPEKDLAAALTEQAWQRAVEGRRIIVFCNGRRTAQEVARALADRSRKAFGKAVETTELLVGERRGRERAALYGDGAVDPGGGSKVFARFRPGTCAEPDGHPAFLVATSAGEVGVDLDADDLVCDLVAWERMVQRFGRVNRRPDPGVACIEVVPAVSDRKRHDAEDDVDRDLLATLRAPFESAHWPRNADDGSLQASPIALRRLKDEPALADCLRAAETAEPLRPSLDRPLVEAWAMTSLDEHPGRAEIDPWLRGWVDDEPQTAIAWRARFPLRGDGSGGFADAAATRRRDLAAFFEVAPPHATELLEAPTFRAVEIIQARAKALTEGKPRADDTQQAHPPVLVVLDRRGAVDAVWDTEALAEARKDRLHEAWSGRTVVLDRRLGGLDAAGLLDARAAAPPPVIDADGWGLALDRTWRRRVRYGERTAVAEGDWRSAGYVWRQQPDVEGGEELWVEVWRGPEADPGIGDPAIARYAQTLQQHHDATARAAERIASRLGLPDEHRAMLVAAAAFHDAGKARDLWQNAMRAPRDSQRPYAKTAGSGDGRALGGYRHEFGSLRDAVRPSVPREAAPGPEPWRDALGAARGNLDALLEPLRELALHLIVSHHGHARPVIAAIDPDSDQPPWESRALAQDAALRFERLQQRWGPWGLAWWEALLRAADWTASRETNEAVDPAFGREAAGG